ncbi:prolipoprotein diacylglyceryl transferase [Candidatus Woesearchaeota archaeon]|nr:prolipoprotein diacylglyceryl transferase [Candidatus Woesearchaeota archaeon]
MITFLPIEQFYYIFDLKLPYWGTSFLLALLIFFYLYLRDRSTGIPKKHKIQLLVHFVFWGFFGMTLYRGIIYGDFENIFRMKYKDSFGVILGILVFLAYIRFNKIPLAKTMDMITIPLITLASIARIGCMLIADEIGFEAGLPWSIMQLGELRHPVGLYYVIFSFAILFFLLWLKRKPIKAGNLFLSMSLLYSSTRILIDFTRKYPSHSIFGLSPHQVAWGLFLIVNLIIFWRYNNVSKRIYYAIINLPAYVMIRFFPKDNGKRFFKLYTYFRWLDDIVDDPKISYKRKKDLLDEQKNLIAKVFSGNLSGARHPAYEEKCLIDSIIKGSSNNDGFKKHVLEMIDTFYFDISRIGRQKTQMTKKQFMEYSKKIGDAYAFAIQYYYDNNKKQDDLFFKFGHICHMIHIIRDYEDDKKNGISNLPKEFRSKKEWFSYLLNRYLDEFYSYKKKILSIKDKRLKKIYYIHYLRFEHVLQGILSDSSYKYSKVKVLFYILRNIDKRQSF